VLVVPIAATGVDGAPCLLKRLLKAAGNDDAEEVVLEDEKVRPALLLVLCVLEEGVAERSVVCGGWIWKCEVLLVRVCMVIALSYVPGESSTIETRSGCASWAVSSGGGADEGARGDEEGDGHSPLTTPATTATKAKAATPPPSHRRRLAAGEDIAGWGWALCNVGMWLNECYE